MKGILTGLGLAVAVMFPHRDAVARQDGLSDLPFTVNTSMTNTGVDADARGKILSRQGSAARQGPRIALTNLDPDTSYELVAFVGADTAATSLTVFTTDRKGAFTVTYLKGGESSVTPTREPLPFVLDPICGVREISVVDGSAATVLRADMTDPDKWRYDAKRPMVNTGFLVAAAGSVRIAGTHHSSSFRMQATGLTPSTEYRLTIAPSTSETYTSDKAGKLNVKKLPAGSPAILDIHAVALTDGTGLNVVLTSTGWGVPCDLPPRVTITGVTPNPVTGSNGPQPFTIAGANFAAGLTVTLRDETHAQTFANRPIGSQTDTQIVINPDFTTAAATWSVQVVNPANATSNRFRFQVLDPAASGQATIVLAGAADFAILAGSTVTNTGLTTVTGDLGVSSGSAVTGFPPGILVGTQHIADPTAVQAKADLTTAYNDAAGRTVDPVSVSGNLGGLTLAPGLYKSTSSLGISSGDLTLDALGDENAVWIFQVASTLTTTPGRQVILSGNAKASNVFWQVGTSATLGTTSVFKGTIMADQSITLETGATLDGRALARIGAVTLNASSVTKP